MQWTDNRSRLTVDHIDGGGLLQAESPDEEALVQGARYLGYMLIARSSDVVVLNVQGRTMELRVLAVLEFSSARKRMSIICRLPDGKIRCAEMHD